jgi:hypothetical protein
MLRCIKWYDFINNGVTFINSMSLLTHVHFCYWHKFLAHCLIYLLVTLKNLKTCDGKIICVPHVLMFRLKVWSMKRRPTSNRIIIIAARSLCFLCIEISFSQLLWGKYFFSIWQMRKWKQRNINSINLTEDILCDNHYDNLMVK